MNVDLVLVLIVAAAAVSLDAAAPRVPNDLKRLLLKPQVQALGATTNNPRCSNLSRSCASCNSVNVCAYVGAGYRLISTDKCPDSTPFCYNGACVKSSPVTACSQSPPVADDFTCTDDEELQGYYPAPFDCAKYYVCSRGVAYVYNCPAGQVYDQASAGCVLLDANNGNCNTFRCSSSGYELYGPDPSVYAYCVYYSSAMVSRCPQDYRMNPQNGNEPCRPVCSRKGRIADVDDRRAYYDCFLLDTNVFSAPSRAYCPLTMLFDGAKQRCVEDPSQTTTTTESYTTGPPTTPSPAPA